MKLSLSYQAGKKIKWREEKVKTDKIWELDSDNSDVYSEFTVESNINESSDSSRSTGMLHVDIHICSAMFSFVCFLRPATLVWNANTVLCQPL